MDVIRWAITTIITRTTRGTKNTLIWTFNLLNKFDRSHQHGHSALALEAPTPVKGMVCSEANYDLGHDDLRKPLAALSEDMTNKLRIFFFLAVLLDLEALTISPFAG